MAYDRYNAICRPLHYWTIMDGRTCVKMAAAAWASNFLNALLHTGNAFSIPLCQGNRVDQFFCEIPQILKLSCSESYLREVGLIVVSACLIFGCFVFTVLSYVQIFRAVLRIPSEQGRHKVLSMCLPHLAVVSLYISTGMFAYLKPSSVFSPSLDLELAVLYSVVPPNIIYSHRLLGPVPAQRLMGQLTHTPHPLELLCPPPALHPLWGPLLWVHPQPGLLCWVGWGEGRGGAICKRDESCVLEVTDEVVKQDKSQYGHLHTSLVTGFQPSKEDNNWPCYDIGQPSQCPLMQPIQLQRLAGVEFLPITPH
ncbi:olfactory receptor 14A16-like [Rhea pennata]|uniref:olfactory receptor 14A16-like n=1 Tax=Rhea pennata TaxID=8795 RepID=UPI002E25A2B0